MRGCEVEGCDAFARGRAVYRVSPLGELFVGRCYEHLTPDQMVALDPGVLELTQTIEHDNRRP